MSDQIGQVCPMCSSIRVRETRAVEIAAGESVIAGHEYYCGYCGCLFWCADERDPQLIAPGKRLQIISKGLLLRTEDELRDAAQL